MGGGGEARAQVQDQWGRSPFDPMYGVDPNYNTNPGGY
jgi:hypothetical protein